MIDEQKIIGLLQAKALGCLDNNDSNDMQEFIDGGHLFPWDELGKYQNVASLLSLALQLELPDPELKDRVALKLIKLSEQLRIKKILEEDKFEVEEDLDEKIEEFTNIQEPFVDPPIEIENEEPAIDENLSAQLVAEESTFNLDEVVLPGFDDGKVTDVKLQTDLTIESPFETLIDEAQIEYPEVEEVEIQEVLPKPETPKTVKPEPLIIEPDKVSKPIEEPEDQNKQVDWTKKSVAEKMFKAIEQDFDSLKYHYEESERKITRGLLFVYIIITVLLALLIFSFFKFNSDINTLNNEVKDLKKKVTSSLYDEQKSNPDHYFFS